jgi:hypothetical protein
MFEWKPPDPRLVALVRRLEAAIRRRFSGVSRSRVASSGSVGEMERDQPSDDAVRDAASAPDGHPPAA